MRHDALSPFGLSSAAASGPVIRQANGGVDAEGRFLPHLPGSFDPGIFLNGRPRKIAAVRCR